MVVTVTPGAMKGEEYTYQTSSVESCEAQKRDISLSPALTDIRL